MANVVYGVFPSNEASEPAIHELVNHTPPFSVQTFENQPIDANHLPEGATEFGRNIVLSTIWGGVLGAIFGLGFPPFRGGPFRFVDQVSAHRVVERLREYEQSLGVRFAPAPALIELAESGQTYHTA